MQRLKLGCGGGYKLAGGPLCPVDAPVGGECLWKNRAFLHGALPGQIGLAMGDVQLIAGHGADRGRTPILIHRTNVSLHRRQLHAVGNCPIQVFLIAELRSQRIHMFSLKDNLV